MKTILLVVLIMLAINATSTPAQDEAVARQNGRKLEGAWSIVVTERNCTTGMPGRSFEAMETFARGGTMIEFSTGANTASIPANIGNRTTAQGVWNYAANGVYSSSFQFFRIGIDGVYRGKTTATGEITMGEDGDSFTATRTQQGFDLAGNPLVPRCDNRVGTRIQ